MKWHEYLTKINKNKLWSREEIETWKVEHWMQEQFPGPYRICETWDKETNTIVFALKFNSNEEEIEWKLKNS